MIGFCKFMSQRRFDLWDVLWWAFLFTSAAFKWPLWLMVPVGAVYLTSSILSYIAVGGRAGLRQ